MIDNKLLTNRIQTYIDYRKIDVWEFERQLGLTKGVLYNATKKNKTIGSDKLEIIITNCGDLNAKWLLTGNGEMIEKEQKSVCITNRDGDNIHQRIQVGNSIGDLENEALKREIDTLQKEVNNMKELLAAKDKIIQDKETIISLLTSK